jgi:hypothetical protein
VRRLLSFGALVLAAAVIVEARQRPTFRTGTSVVLVDVLVREGASPVRGLGRDDLQVFDEGIPQRIDELLPEQMPIDLTILLDASGSTSGVIDSFRRSASEVSSMLRPEDRVRLMAFATGVEEVAPLGASLPSRLFEAPLPSGLTSLHDALVLTFGRARDPGRRHLVVTYTDGVDNGSVLDAAAVARVARRTESVLHVVLEPTGSAAREDDLRLLREAAESTGGGTSLSSRDAVAPLRQVFDEFRESYVLRYTPTGVSAAGWHRISVRLTRPDAARYTVRARKGYFGGG